MQTLTPEQHKQWQVDGYLHLEQVFDADEVNFYCDQMDRFRKVPGYEPDRRPDLPIGHYSWMEHTPDLDPGGFMDRRELLTYHQAFIDLIDRAPVFDHIVDDHGAQHPAQHDAGDRAALRRGLALLYAHGRGRVAAHDPCERSPVRRSR